MDSDDLQVSRAGERLRFRWECDAAECVEHGIRNWFPDATLPCAHAATHTVDTGHATVIIRQSEQRTHVRRRKV